MQPSSLACANAHPLRIWADVLALIAKANERHVPWSLVVTDHTRFEFATVEQGSTGFATVLLAQPWVVVR